MGRECIFFLLFRGLAFHGDCAVGMNRVRSRGELVDGMRRDGTIHALYRSDGVDRGVGLL